MKNHKACSSLADIKEVKEINLIYAESPYYYDDIDFGNVIYGDETMAYCNNQIIFCRDNNGMTSNKNITSRINGYVAVYNTSLSGIISKSLFVIFEGVVKVLKKYFCFDKIYDSKSYIDK